MSRRFLCKSINLFSDVWQLVDDVSSFRIVFSAANGGQEMGIQKRGNLTRNPKASVSSCIK